MVFRKLQLEDISAVKSALYSYAPNQANDYTILGLFFWRDYLNVYVALESEGVYIYQYVDDRYLFYYPLCDNVEAGFKRIIEYCTDNQLVYGFYPLTQDDLAYLDAAGVSYELKQSEDFNDYLYYVSDLAGFKGKKYHTQKNHLNRFDREYPVYSYERITDANITGVREFFDRYLEAKAHEQLSATEIEEHSKIPELLSNIKEYNVFGFCLKINDIIQGFELGEIVGDMYYSHIQKANRDFEGIYTKMVNLMSKELENSVVYVNREEDLGDLGLRASKKSYRPCGFIEKKMIFVN